MKKFIWIILFAVILSIGVIVYFYNSKSNSNYYTQKSSFNDSSDTQTNFISNNPSTNITPNITETEISNFSTRIQNKKDLNRQGNITITCSALNNTTVPSGKTFSFCDTVGQSTEERGYKKANVIVQGTEIKGLGGGNCQVSSTLYNAVLAIPELEIIERHPHSAPVPYIEEGKDAAISYRLS